MDQKTKRHDLKDEQVKKQNTQPIYSKKTVGSNSNAKNGKNKVSDRNKYKQKESNPTGNKPVANVAVVIISVVVILLVIWLLAKAFISMTDTTLPERKHAFATTSEDQKPSQKESQSLSESSAQEQGQNQNADESSSSADTVKPLTEGPADLNNPDSWIGKTFHALEAVNVRSDVGTSSNIVGGMDSADKITVTKTKTQDDTLWVYGKVERSNGETVEGWVYAPGLNLEPVNN